jgi:hypothetical protein
MHSSVVLGDEGEWGYDPPNERDPALFQTKPERAPWLFLDFTTSAQSQRTKQLLKPNTNKSNPFVRSSFVA